MYTIECGHGVKILDDRLSVALVIHFTPHFLPKLFEESLLQAVLLRIANELNRVLAGILICDRWCRATHIHSRPLQANNPVCKRVRIESLAANLEGSF